MLTLLWSYTVLIIVTITRDTGTQPTPENSQQKSNLTLSTLQRGMSITVIIPFRDGRICYSVGRVGAGSSGTNSFDGRRAQHQLCCWTVDVEPNYRSRRTDGVAKSVSPVVFKRISDEFRLGSSKTL